MNTAILRKKLFAIEKLYITLFISHTMISQVKPLSYYVAFEQVRSAVGLLVMACGVGLILAKALVAPRRFLRSNSKYLIAYFCIGILSCVVNCRYGVFENIKSLIWAGIHFFLLFPFFAEIPIGQQRKVCRGIFTLPVAIWSITGLASIGEFIIGYSAPGQGWFYNRLFGVYNDPNFASNASLCVAFVCIQLLSWSKEPMEKMMYRLALGIQVVYVLLAYSRGAWIAGIAACFVYLFVSNSRKSKFSCEQFLDRFVFSCVRLVAVLLTFAIVRVTVISAVTQVREATAVAYASTEDQSQSLQTGRSQAANQAGKEASVSTSLDRTDLEGKDFSNGRVEIWKRALSVLKEKPLLGISPQNLQEYYNEKNQSDGGNGTAYHNGYIAVIVGTGLLGFLIIVMFIGKNVGKFFQIYMLSSNCSDHAVYAAMIVTMAFAACATHELFWINSVGTIFFWISLGSLNYDQCHR